MPLYVPATGGSGSVATDTIWDAAGDLAVGSGADTASKLSAGATSGHVLTSNGSGAAPSWQASGGGGGSVPTLLLDYTQATDVGSITLTAATWVDIFANQNFTVASGSSLVEFLPRGVGIDNGGGGNYITIRLVIDSAGTPINKLIGGVFRTNVNMSVFAGLGPVYVSGLSAAVHTVKVQAMSDAGNAFFCRPATTQEFWSLQVVEHA